MNKNKYVRILDDAQRDFNGAKDTKTLQDLRVFYLGKNGIITNLLKTMKDLPLEERVTLGKDINIIKTKIQSIFENKSQEIQDIEKRAKQASEAIDVTFSPIIAAIGSKHPITKVKDQITSIFNSLGFSTEDGPEIELTKYNFELLNIPSDHPARAFGDSFYISDDVMLRTQTSGIQARIMETSVPPIKIICPGKVYRPDDDATHSPMFHQIEGLYVDKDVSLYDLKHVLELFAKSFFDETTKVRFRPSYFPFTEPSVEVDLSCALCKGSGCSLCKRTGWIELLGAGVVNPIVLDNCGIDSSIYSGYAFGIGLERAAMVKYGIPDMRLLFEGNIKFLEQFI